MPDLYERETEFRSIRKEGSNPGLYSFDSKQEQAEAINYVRRGPAGGIRNLRIDEYGCVTFSGRQPVPEVFGLEDQNFHYQTKLSELEGPEVANQILQLHEDQDYQKLDSMINRLEEEILNAR